MDFETAGLVRPHLGLQVGQISEHEVFIDPTPECGMGGLNSNQAPQEGRCHEPLAVLCGHSKLGAQAYPNRPVKCEEGADLGECSAGLGCRRCHGSPDFERLR